MKYYALTFLISLLFLGCTNINSFEGYKTHKTTHVSSINSDVVELTHKKSGAQIVLIKNSDPARTFMAGFRTPPYDNTGLFHIFEHSVLEGSRLYPSKSNFFKVNNSTVADFLNAMTGPVYTLYPFITKSEKDFENLMSYYMDAVYFPKVTSDPRLVKREGWRFEVDPKTKKMSINGVVFSEMKGAFSNPNRWIDYHIQKTMVPQTPYSYSSGGFPADIASLTFEQIKDAHKKYYHPQNSIITLYGDIDYKKILNTIDKDFLSHFEKQSDFVQPKISLQTDFNYSKDTKVEFYPGEKLKDRDYLAKAYVLGKTTAVEDIAFAVLNQAFITNDAAPLRLRILKDGIAKSVYPMGFGGEDNGLAFTFMGTNAENKDKLNKILADEISKAAKNGIDPELLTSILNKYEFHQKEKNSNGAKKGYNIVRSVISHWIHPKIKLTDKIDSVGMFKKVRTVLADPEFVKDYFRKRLKNNTKTQWIAIKPDPNFSEKFNKRLDNRIQKALSENSVDHYIAEQKEFNKWLKEEETQEVLDKLPVLKLSDIKSDMKSIPFTKIEKDGYTQLDYPLNTNGISYVSIYFDLSELSQDDLLNLSYFSSFLSSSDTNKYNFKQLSKETDTYIGSISFSANAYPSVKNPSQFKPLFSINLSFLNENIDKVFELTEEMTLHNQFTPTSHLNDLYGEFKSHMNTSVAQRVPQLAYSAANGYFFPALNAFNSRLQGVAFEQQLKKDDFNANKLSPLFKLMAKKIFNKQQIKLVTLTSSKSDLPMLTSSVNNFLKNVFSTNTYSSKKDKTWPLISEQYDGFVIPGEVNYTSLTTSYSKYNLAYSGAMKVYAQYLNNNFLIPQLREQMGAYGARASFTKNGLFSVLSYKDPNLKKSFEVYKQIPTFMAKEGVHTQKAINASILGSLKRYYSDQSVVAKSGLMTALFLSDQTWEDYVRVKNEIIETKPEDFQKITNVLKKAIPKGVKSAAGNKENLKSEGKFLNSILSFE